MDQFRHLLLSVWRAASQAAEIGPFAAALAELLREHLPLARLAVYRLDREQTQLAPLAVTPEAPGALTPSSLMPTQLRRISSWHRKGVPFRSGGADVSIIKLLAGKLTEGTEQVLALPLTPQHSEVAALVLVALPGRKFTTQHAKLLQALAEPLGVALDNDARLHELKSLREAAEAERRSLLNRLGRKELSEAIVGADAGLAPVMQRVEMVSRSDVPVLLLGETGTGKEVLARAIHNRSGRSTGPFIRVNCGAIPRDLIDSQLFGHEKGSFTGAHEARKGWFERADDGTLLLDEIGELPLDAQVRFLRVLQDGLVERVGGHEPLRVNVRVIAATHRDLAAMVLERTFREDLWYRIAVFPIVVPPLRERTDDIAALARHFAERAATRFCLAPVEPTLEDIERLTQYHWPGNIRELAAVIDRAAILGDGKTLEVAAALGVSQSAGQSEHIPDKVGRESASVDGASGFPTLNEAVRRHIEAALRSTRGRIEGPTGAAALLRINPHTLRAKMRKLGIDWAAYR